MLGHLCHRLRGDRVLGSEPVLVRQAADRGVTLREAEQPEVGAEGKRRGPANPVQAVLFSSFIVQ